MRTYVYADESGNFDFSNGQSATQYFILASVAVHESDIEAIENDLRQLRQDLAWQGYSLPKGFHASNDKQRVRNQFFDILCRHNFRVDATILEKRKASPYIRTSDDRFYRFAWYAHLTGLAPSLSSLSDELLVTAASISKKFQTAFCAEIKIAERKMPANIAIRCDVVDAAANPMLQVADYCAWALQRKWERQPSDTGSYTRISGNIATEFDLFGGSGIRYY